MLEMQGSWVPWVERHVEVDGTVPIIILVICCHLLVKRIAENSLEDAWGVATLAEVDVKIACGVALVRHTGQKMVDSLNGTMYHTFQDTRWVGSCCQQVQMEF